MERLSDRETEGALKLTPSLRLSLTPSLPHSVSPSLRLSLTTTPTPVSHPLPTTITLDMMRQSLYSAVVSDALDSLGFRRQSPRIRLAPLTVETTLVGRAKTTLWADMFHDDPRPYELELKAVDSCQAGDVLIAAAGGSLHSALWGELLSTASRNSGCVGAVVDGGVRDLAKMRQMQFP